MSTIEPTIIRTIVVPANEVDHHIDDYCEVKVTAFTWHHRHGVDDLEFETSCHDDLEYDLEEDFVAKEDYDEAIMERDSYLNDLKITIAQLDAYKRLYGPVEQVVEKKSFWSKLKFWK